MQGLLEAAACVSITYSDDASNLNRGDSMAQVNPNYDTLETQGTLDGTEVIQSRKSGIDKQTTVGAIKTYLATNGTTSTPNVLTSASTGTVKVFEQVTNLPAASSGVTDLISDYEKINVVGAGVAGASPVVDRKILNVGLTGGSNNSTIDEGYIRQDTLTKGGTGTVSTLKGQAIEVNVGADNFTATNGVQGLNVIMSGSATIGTGKVKGVSIDINGSSKVDVALQIAGAPVEFIKLGDTGPSFTAGSATTDSGIKSAMGITAPKGSVYFSSNGIGEVWIMQTTTWTQLTIN